jgi:hypothetical protein
MRTYRLYFLDVHIMGECDFQAVDDDQATAIAEILFDACSDRCRSWQIWEADVVVAVGPQKLHWAHPDASHLTELRQENVVQCEERILRSAWAIASSERLLAQLDQLKASKTGASRYSSSP